MFGITRRPVKQLVGFEYSSVWSCSSLIERRFRCELYNGMESIAEVHKMVTIMGSMWPQKKYIVNASSPHEGLLSDPGQLLQDDP